MGPFKSWVLRTFFNVDRVARWLAGEDLEDTRTYKTPGQPYRVAPWVRIAISRVAGCVASIPVRLTDAEGDLVETGPLMAGLFDPLNRGLIRRLSYQVVGNFLLTGEAHIVFGLKAPGEPTIDVFGASNAKALVSDDGLELKGWEFTVPDKHGQGRKYLVDLGSIESWIDPTLYPGCRFRGLSRLESLALTLAEDQAAAEHNATILARGGGPKGFLKTEQPLSPEQADDLEKRWDSKYTGAKNSGRVAVLGKGTEWQSMVQTNKELMILESRKLSRETVLASFEVPPSIAGLFEGSNRAHDASAREGFWVNTIWPIAEQVSDLYTRSFVPRAKELLAVTGSRSYRRNPSLRALRAATPKSKHFVWLDMSAVPALRAWHTSQAEAALKWIEAGVPLNDVIEKNDLPYEPQEWGDTWWVAGGKKPVEQVIDEWHNPPQPATPPAPAPPAPPPKKNAEEIKALGDGLWQRWSRSFSGLERSTVKSLRSYFFRQRAEALARLENSDVAKSFQKGWIDDVLPDLIEENKLLVDIMEPHVKSGMKLGGKQAAKEVKGEDPFNLPDPQWDKYLPERFAQLSGTVNVTTYKRLRTQLEQAQNAGESLQDIAVRIKNVFRQANDARALTIARTETAASVSKGRFETMKHNGVELKAWVTAGDEHVRESHQEAGKQYADGIPLGAKFRLAGGTLDHPGDYNGPASEIINCRCVLVPMLKGEKSSDTLQRYQDVRFEDWSESDEA